MPDKKYNNFKAPSLGKNDIKIKSELFRKKFWGNSIPIDIEKIIELKLEIDIIPIPDLMDFCNTDAFMTSNWRSIYVDKKKYEDERYLNRLRFSYAHEIGHFVLHKDLYKSFGIKKIEDFYKFIEGVSQEQYGYIESQANKFANYLLIPRDTLLEEKNKLLLEIKEKTKNIKINSDIINSYLSIPLAKKFCVSEDAMEIALNDISS